MDNVLKFEQPAVEPPRRKRRGAVEMRFINAFVRLIADVYPLVVAEGADDLEEMGMNLLYTSRDPALSPSQRDLAAAIGRQIIAEAAELRLDTLTESDDGPPEAAA